MWLLAQIDGLPEQEEGTLGIHTYSTLVRFPSYPFTLETLRPDADLASLAAIMYESGHETTVLDYGTVETFERLFPVEVRTTLAHYAQKVEGRCLAEGAAHSKRTRSAFSLFWRLGRMSGIVRAHHEHICHEIAHEISEGPAADFVVFKVTHMNDLRSAETICERLRSLLSEIKTVVWCPQLDAQNIVHGRVLSRVFRTFDCVYLGKADRDFTRICEAVARRRPWGVARNIIFKEGGAIQRVTRDTEDDLTPLPAPLYSSAVYASLECCTKAKVFDVHTVPNSPFPTPHGLQAQRRPAASIVEEVKQLVDECSARAIHFIGGASGSNQAQKVAYELLSKRLSIPYSVEVQMSSATPATVSALKASGCRAASFQIDTGSQRLLDRYYENGFGVSRAEQILRACRFSNIFTVAKLIYPSIEDDYHTKDETLRLLDRARPDAAPVELPAQGRRLKKMRRQNAELRAEIEELGIFTDMTAQSALMADLAGFAGREEEFDVQIRQRFYLGDSIGIATVIEKINHAAGVATGSGLAGPVSPYPDVMGN